MFFKGIWISKGNLPATSSQTPTLQIMPLGKTLCGQDESPPLPERERLNEFAEACGALGCGRVGKSQGETIYTCRWARQPHKSPRPRAVHASEQISTWLWLPACKSSSTSKFFQGGPGYCGPETSHFCGFLSKFLSYRLCVNNGMIDLSHSALGWFYDTTIGTGTMGDWNIFPVTAAFRL